MAKDIATERVRIEVSDGTTMDAYVARPADGGPYPGLLVLQEIFGVNAHIRDVAERLAREGYATLAPDLFHRQMPGHEGGYVDIQPSISMAMQYTAEQSGADLKAAYEALYRRTHVRADRIGAIGFCLGGRLAFVANAVAPLRAAVSFYGGGIAADKLHLAERLSGPTLFFWAGRDHYIPTEQHRAVTDAMRKLDKPFVDVEFSNVNHGFFCDARTDYNVAAASQAWSFTLAFLQSHLGA